jgi:hypothetical protein
MADNPGWESLGEGLLILAAVWWAWCAYGWLTNSIDPDENLNRVCMFSAMGGMLMSPSAFRTPLATAACSSDAPTSSSAPCSSCCMCGTLRAPRRMAMTGVNTITRTIGGAFGGQIVATIISGGGSPTECSFTLAFAVIAGSLVLSILAALAIPKPGWGKREPAPSAGVAAEARG